jgi:hypothetical protein
VVLVRASPSLNTSLSAGGLLLADLQQFSFFCFLILFFQLSFDIDLIDLIAEMCVDSSLNISSKSHVEILSSL